MSEKVLAKVDYIKPLQDKPYAEVIAGREQYHGEVLQKLAEIVGRDGVTDAPDELEQYSRAAGIELGCRPSFVVRPKNIEEVIKIVKFANEALLPVIPASSGTHMYGCALPRMGGLVVDLSGWKKILKIDRRNRAVRVEPGVTYGELECALEAEGLRALFPLLPRKDQSVLTSHLEAQPKLIPEFNFSEPIYTAEIVMPEGNVFRTGTGALAPAELTQTDLIGPWGPGFDWNRLYTRSQGTLGIATWLNIMAEPLPAKEKIFFTAFKNPDEFARFTYLIQKKWIGYECFGLNRTTLATILACKMPDDFIALKNKLPEYIQLFRIGGLKRFPDERLAYQEADFLEAARDCGVSPQATIAAAPQAAAFFEKNLRRCWEGDVYWKDAYKGASADIFFITTMNKASAFISAMQEEAAGSHYSADDVGVYLQPIENGRAMHLEFMIPYDPKDAAECARVRKLHISASERMYSLGAVFTRAYGAWAEMVNGRNGIQFQTAKLIKETLDPNNIMNPGKLGF